MTKSEIHYFEIEQERLYKERTRMVRYLEKTIPIMKNGKLKDDYIKLKGQLDAFIRRYDRVEQE